jgi:hypothetical protein
MARYYVFNGDADGLCALQQLRLIDASEATLVTGVKRDIGLLERVDAAAADTVTVLDISLDRNRAALLRLLAAGASVRYFDHHFAGELPQHARFEPHIEETGEVCTSILVDRHIGGRFPAWTIAAAFGDGLPRVGTAMASALGVDAATLTMLEKLGVSLNYNAYGESIADLHIHPAELANQMLPFEHPVDFVRHSPTFARLASGYEQDLRQARAVAPARQVPGATVVVLGDKPWARRASGVLANELARDQPDHAIAVLSPKAAGGFVVSVRVPAARLLSADEFCRGFESGGGRKLAAGIDSLDAGDVDGFVQRFEAHYRTPA